jgi:tryptophan-rich sensory protein
MARDGRLGDLATLLAPSAVGLVSAVVTAPGMRGWYRTLRLPPWNPPGEVFGPVWTTLYLMMGVAAVLVRRSGVEPRRIEAARAVDTLQLALNAAWSVAFFGRRNPGAGLAVIGALWVAIAATIALDARVDRRAAALLVPYLAWVTFAAALNAWIWRANRGGRPA